ncbi:YbaB/EbfC family nucleoid-associated protein [Caminibacter mediatlanticus TB-2]|uniref:Nucleoid-associated protein FE773_01615 n=1 Tax=Caminibacter mediatlanticus TB-2 TaxID=391592 RepID=A0ABX5V6Q7_9BACT|nr:YbaB/EbfC family nucleoid-associated protein [Caminibacter mediatlanticus]QCT93923.1 YbaB/EbfC family nucleoid-associated protein [Caminibacter mediatlanticus TB-2]
MFGNLDLNEMMKKIQENMAEADNKTYTAKSGGGLVEATVNGKFEVVDIKIDDSLLEDKESLQILLMSAINDAIKMAVEDKKNQAMNMFGGLNLGNN